MEIPINTYPNLSQALAKHYWNTPISASTQGSSYREIMAGMARGQVQTLTRISIYFFNLICLRFRKFYFQNQSMFKRMFCFQIGNPYKFHSNISQINNNLDTNQVFCFYERNLNKFHWTLSQIKFSWSVYVQVTVLFSNVKCVFISLYVFFFFITIPFVYLKLRVFL